MSNCIDHARATRARMDASQLMARRGVQTDAANMTAADLEQVAALFAPWAADTAYVADAIVVDSDGQLYQCLQAHTSQAGWDPHATPALWHRLGLSADDPDAIPAWVQPVTVGYAKGAQARHSGKVWTSNVDNNVWEPGAPGVTQWDEVTAA